LRATELRALRLDAGLTQRELARKLGMTIRSLSRYETGARKITRVLAIAVRCVATHKP
jgi:transcriptional regulator with XRE-family HTH domain